MSSISSDVFVLKEQNYPVFSLGANLTAPIFNGWALQANVDVRTAEQKIAIADYGRVASRAFSEVESALSATFAADEREALFFVESAELLQREHETAAVTRVLKRLKESHGIERRG